MTFGREDREQDPSAVQVHLPPGLLAKIPAAELCTEAQATSGTCGSESEIGSATALAGSGAHPYPLSGRVYLTGPYKGSPFGLSIETAAEGGPFHLGTVIVRAAIAIDPNSGAITVTSDPLPAVCGPACSLRLHRGQRAGEQDRLHAQPDQLLDAERLGDPHGLSGGHRSGLLAIRVDRL